VDGAARKLTILLSEGASPSARHSAYILGASGHAVDVCDAQRLCLARFSRCVHRYHRCPAFVACPADWLQWMRKQIDRGGYDVLFPVHDQVYLLAKFRDRFRDVGLAVPPFEAVRTIQSKPAFARQLEKIGLPQPAYVLARTAKELEPPWGFPCFVKAAYSTAGQGVWFVKTPAELARAAEQLHARGNLNGEKEVIVQQPGRGELSVVQAVFQEGKLIGVHSYRTPGGGVGGSSYARESVSHPTVIEHLQTLGRKLSWHGALHAEYFYDTQGDKAEFIELNPRIGETLNAALAGVNLCDLMLKISLGESVNQLQVSRPGVRSHNLMLRLLGVAEQGLGRRRVLYEIIQSLQRRNEYAESEEELVRISDDLPSLLPTAWIALQLIAQPSRVRGIVRAAMQSVSLTEAAVREMDSM